jgi:hypothetical protein
MAHVDGPKCQEIPQRSPPLGSIEGSDVGNKAFCIEVDCAVGQARAIGRYKYHMDTVNGAHHHYLSKTAGVRRALDPGLRKSHEFALHSRDGSATRFNSCRLPIVCLAVSLGNHARCRQIDRHLTSVPDIPYTRCAHVSRACRIHSPSRWRDSSRAVDTA